ncbi:tRNA-Thr(GGU) m(6)t(6)A37 methyltransferase TsaA [Malonomonas rubra DSM 5091]|uniref:tRNA-Thr(GGU) m(6)t(6)A37 methyltransferase TsaA n=1 Tax=Malonomonas rubra DSM 5091 TaxID=1122189 RepID=A0A1M6JT69_MALRU|nr:tRNA (N6-threonylcarbamoyladenosine(37)-N6)-methyltransferase TrmO [Malonomonas rubra]SHJ49780.1 tRNA-Thr(GGU) m(6)t(6)A37 methyltransferase TsaA [Malonomonas rubra DSM 5091]
MTYEFTPIGAISSPYREKFATPRQPGLTKAAVARIVLSEEVSSPETVRELEGFSHIWLLFLFDKNYQQGWTPTVRPPRLGGNKRVGVFASRSPFRPNPIGLSPVKLLAIEQQDGRITLKVQGADLIDGTPILDIKPYIAYSDAIADAVSGFADKAPSLLPVEFSAAALEQVAGFVGQTPELEELVRETLALDPRPAYQREAGDEREYGVLLDRYNVRWRVVSEVIEVLDISLVEKS